MQMAVCLQMTHSAINMKNCTDSIMLSARRGDYRGAFCIPLSRVYVQESTPAIEQCGAAESPSQMNEPQSEGLLFAIGM